MTKTLYINDIDIFVKDKYILNVNQIFEKNKKYIFTGANGSGKSSLFKTIAGNEQYTIKKGSIVLDNIDITNYTPQERFISGIFMSFQEPPILENISYINLIYESLKITNNNVYYKDLLDTVKNYCDMLQLDQSLIFNSNITFSGGEKKKMEILQMLIFNPQVCLLDEIDTGLDTYSKQKLVQIIDSANKTFLIISHNFEFIKQIKPDKVFVVGQNKIHEN